MRWEEKAKEGKIETNQWLEAYAVKPLKLEELRGGEPQPHVRLNRGVTNEITNPDTDNANDRRARARK